MRGENSPRFFPELFFVRLSVPKFRTSIVRKFIKPGIALNLKRVIIKLSKGKESTDYGYFKDSS